MIRQLMIESVDDSLDGGRATTGMAVHCALGVLHRPEVKGQLRDTLLSVPNPTPEQAVDILVGFITA